MQISGYKTRSVFDRYNIVSDRDLAEAAARMEQRMQTSLRGLPGSGPLRDEMPVYSA